MKLVSNSIRLILTGSSEWINLHVMFIDPPKKKYEPFIIKKRKKIISQKLWSSSVIRKKKIN